MPIRGVRGAIPVKENRREAIWKASKELALKMVRANRLNLEDIACIIFTLTPDLNSDFPAYAVRQMRRGWEHVPLLCARELDVPGAMPGLLRILMLVNSEASQKSIRHVYIGRAAKLKTEIKSKGR